jgi:hypothetical protein
MPNYGDDLNTSKIAVVGFISVIVVFALIILMQVLFYWAEAQQRLVKNVDQPYLENANLTADQQAKLTKYQWLDPNEKKFVVIPIKQAMELVVNKLAKEQSRELTPGDGESPEEKEKTIVR